MLAWGIVGAVLGVIWLSRLVDAAVGMPTVADVATPEHDRSPDPQPFVTIVVPARNEAEKIGDCLRSLLELDYANYEIIAVNDRSEDSTGAIMDGLAAGDSSRLRVIHVRELPPQWLGKTHAMWTAAEEARGDYILFTDGDVIYRPDALRRAVAYAERHRCDHLILYPTVQMKTFGERMMISFFQIKFVFGHRAWKVSDPKARDHMGVGAFNLIRRTAYEQLGTYEALRMNVIDDINLGRLVKKHGLLQHGVFGPGLITLRWAKGALGVAGNLKKNVFALLRFRLSLVLLGIAFLLIVNLGPFVGAIFAAGWTKLGYVVALASLFALYVGMSRVSQVSPLYFFTHPLSTLLFVWTVLHSALDALVNNAVTWRGTKYPLSELRKHL
jgi:glycosyltransferase involved in cell wall biosynthesis